MRTPLYRQNALDCKIIELEFKDQSRITIKDRCGFGMGKAFRHPSLRLWVESHRRCGETVRINRIQVMIVKKGLADLAVLIRSIQKVEGHQDCFRRTRGSCEQLDCAWRKYCLEEPRGESLDKCPSPSQNQDRGEKEI
jgi:hypothetical protein